MTVIVGSARIDENGNAHGGKAGDQNSGKEVSTQNWYLHSKGWYVLRAKSAEVQKKIGDAMLAACANNNIGYDQYQRDTLYNDVKAADFDPAKTTKPVECDCSSLVRVCVNYAGIAVGNFRTTNEASVLVATGEFVKFTDDKHCKASANLLYGDILVTRTQGHTVVVLSDGVNAAEERTGIVTPSEDEPQSGVIVAPGSWNVRSAPTTKAKSIAIVRGGDKLNVIETDWLPVTLDDGSVGWISPKGVLENG